MAENQAFESEIGRISGVLKTMHEALRPPAAMLAQADRDLVIPDAAQLAATEERLRAELPGWWEIEASVARLVAGLATEIGVRKAEFDSREQPTRLEKPIGYISKAAMRRRLEARWRRSRPLHHLAELLGRIDLLTGLVRAERDTLLSERRACESQLAAFIDHRPKIMGILRSEIGGGMTRVEAARHIGRCVGVFQAFVDVLNGRVGSGNVCLHKLMTDTEDLLIHYQAISEILGLHGDENLDPDVFPNLAAGMGRFSSGMLTVHGLDLRRDRADRAFIERFPPEAAEEKAAEEETAEVRPAKIGLRLPAIPRLKFLRS